jgi:hypothetical protein
MATDSPDAALTARLERIKKLAEELARVQGESKDARDLANRIRHEVDAARADLKTPNT